MADFSATGSIIYSFTTGSHLVSFPFEEFETSGSIEYVVSKFSCSAAASESGYKGSEGITKIITAGAAADYNKTLGWVGSLTNIDPKLGYWLKITGSGGVQTTASITNVLIDGDYEDTYDDYNSLVSYPYDKPYSLSDILNPNNNDIFSSIIGQGVAATYTGETWAGSLSSFKTGSGYWFKNPDGLNKTTNLFILTGSNIDYGTGSTYYSCDCDTNPLEDNGYRCIHIGGGPNCNYYPDRHTFGHMGPHPDASVAFFTGSFDGTASLQDSNGNEISGNAAIGFFPQAGTASYAVGAFLWYTHSGSGVWMNGGGTCYLYCYEQFTHARHPLTGYCDHPDNPSGENIFPKLGEPLSVKVYDPSREKVYSASMYNPDGTEYIPSSSLSMASVINYLPAGTGSGNWKYIKLKN